MVGRLSKAEIVRDLRAYVLRVGVLVLILSLFVSAVTVAVIGRSVLNPVLAIHRTLTAAHSDPENPERYKLDLRAENEIGETVSALNEIGRASCRERVCKYV